MQAAGKEANIGPSDPIACLFRTNKINSRQINMTVVAPRKVLKVLHSIPFPDELPSKLVMQFVGGLLGRVVQPGSLGNSVAIRIQ